MVRRGAEKSLEALGVKKTKLSLSRRLASRLSSMMPDSVAGTVPFKLVASGIAAVVIVAVLGWAGWKASTGKKNDLIALVKAPKVSNLLWVPDSKNVIVFRKGTDRQELWDTSAGRFLTKLDADGVSLMGWPPVLMKLNGKAMTPWSPEGEPGAGPKLRLPPKSGFTRWSSNLKVALSKEKDGPFVTWDLAEGAELARFELLDLPAPDISADGRLVAGVAVSDGAASLVFMDAVTGEEVSSLPSEDLKIPKPNIPGGYREEMLRLLPQLVFSLADQTLAVSFGGKLTFVDVSDPETPVINGKEADVRGDMLFIDSGTVYSVAGGTVFHHNLDSGEAQSWLVTPNDLENVSWSLTPDGSRIAVGAENKPYVWIVNTADGSVQELNPLDVPEE